MSNDKYPFPVYSDGTNEWFRLSDMPGEESGLFRDWLIENYLIFDAATKETEEVKDGFFLKYYTFWKRGASVTVLGEKLPLLH